MIHFIKEGELIENGISIRNQKNTLFQIIIRLPMPWTKYKDVWYDFHEDRFYNKAIVRRVIQFGFRVRGWSLIMGWKHMPFYQRILKAWIFRHAKLYDLVGYDWTETRAEREDRLDLDNIYSTCKDRLWSKQ